MGRTRNGRFRHPAGAVLLALAGCSVAVVERTPPMPGPADLVVLNARVVTLDPARPRAEAFAVVAARFRLVGASEAVRALVGPQTRVVDAKGAAIVPGLIDAHLHLFGEGYRRMRLDLLGTGSKDEVLSRVRREVEVLSGTGWIRGRGWDQNDWPVAEFPTAADLDPVGGERPVALTRIDGHAVWVNHRALALAGIGAATPDPSGGKILRDARGAPTGVLIDNAVDLVTAKMPDFTRAEKLEAARRAARACVEAGLTGVHEPGLGGEEVEVLKELYRAGQMPLRIYVMLSPGEALERYLEAGPEVGLFGHRLTIRAVKLYADGALGSRGAALLADYGDDPGNRGLLLLEPAEIERQVRRAALAGLQPAVHAIGDRGNREVLDVYERALAAGGASAPARPRIEHAQVIAPEDLPRFAKLGVIASMQPTHATSDMPWVPARLGAVRQRGTYAWKSLLAGGAQLAFGSDAPVESVKPLWGLYAARTRQDHAGKPEGGFEPQEALGAEEALRGFTTGAAWAAFEEDLKGTISPGKLADFVLLSEDPLAVEPAKLLETQVLATYVGGVAVFEAGAR